MLFNSYGFIVFFPIVVIVYFLLPKRISYLWLLAASYYFYMGMECKVRTFAFGFNNNYICMWRFDSMAE